MTAIRLGLCSVTFRFVPGDDPAVLEREATALRAYLAG